MSAPSSAAAAHGCSHCDSSVPHEHLDLPAIVEAERRRAAWETSVQVSTGALVLAAAVTLAVAIGSAAALVAVPVTVVAWLATTAVGLVVAGSVRYRSPAAAVLAGALTTAGLIPLAALLVAVVGPDGWLTAAAAGATWLATTAVLQLVRTRSWRRLLLAGNRDGDRARQAAVANRERPAGRDVAAWAAQGIVVGVSVWLLAALPWAVVVLVPLAVVLAVARARMAGAR